LTVPLYPGIGPAMANTYSSLHYHIVFSTKNRERWIQPEFETRIWAFLGGIAKKNNLLPIQIGGVEDHVHCLLGATTLHAPAAITKQLKGGSSVWISQNFPALKAFAWQDGYGAFTVSRSALDEVAQYIRNQREHHTTMSFQEEYRAMLQRHGVAFDERYVWG
jgi:REP element-mobilizing transposase RayT